MTANEFKDTGEEFQRHPQAIAIDVWMTTEQGKSCANPTTLSAPAAQQEFLENRLKIAFSAGWTAKSALVEFEKEE